MRNAHPSTCSAPLCPKERHARGLCTTHYWRLRKYGSIDLPKKPEAPPTRWTTHYGYRVVYLPEHPMANSAGAVFEHRLVMAEALGRPLLRDESVHHVNGDKLDNRLENLELWTKSQPAGQRVDDKVEYAIQILRRYSPELLREIPEARTG